MVGLESTPESAAGLPRTCATRKKLIINTDPGIDDAVALLMAFSAFEFDIIGLTTTFGNTSTAQATKNALYLCEISGNSAIPVYEGEHLPLNGGKVRIAEFAHGADGLGDLGLPEPKNKAEAVGAVDFMVKAVADHPDQISILSLGPLTNIAKAMQKDPTFSSKVRGIWVMGGSFFASGNVNPATEAHVYGDPEAADFVFTSGANVSVVGLDTTTRLILTSVDIGGIKDSGGRHSDFLHAILSYYQRWHLSSDHLDGVFLHDACCLAALLRPDLFSFKSGVVRVETTGVCRGLTLLDLNLKTWNGPNPWVGSPPINVAVGIDASNALQVIIDLLLHA